MTSSTKNRKTVHWIESSHKHTTKTYNNKYIKQFDWTHKDFGKQNSLIKFNLIQELIISNHLLHGQGIF